MAEQVQQQWKVAQQLHRELRAQLKEKGSLLEDIEGLISRLRIASETILFLDFDYASSQNVEAVLWDSHSLINNRYRKIVAKLKLPEQKRNVVERRKWDKRYADFLKTSQYYYKGYIQRLASHFKGLKELRIIADRLTLTTLSAEDAVPVSKDTEHRILLSCHATLLRLGDLHRYRNSINTKDRSWEKANAHYNLANDLYPDSGSAFHHMAVVSLSDGNHLDSVYHLYRALAVKEPHPLAAKNIEVEFRKIIALWSGSGQKKSSPAAGGPPLHGPTANMVLWFVRLHAKLYKGEEFSNRDELENEVLSQVTVLLKEQSLEGILDKMVLINIAAEYYAGLRLQATEKSEDFQAYFFFLRLNVRFFFMLLHLLQPELDNVAHDDTPDVTGKKKNTTTETITAVTRRILPALRHYSTWILTSGPVIAAQDETEAINIHAKEMWSTYCTTLNLLIAAFPLAQLPDTGYLLEEDAATVGFKPFRDNEICQIYTYADGTMKSRSTDPGVERHHPNVEMAARIRGLLRDGMLLATSTLANGKKQYPIHATGGQFYFVKDGLPEPSPLLGEHLPDDASQAAPAPSYEPPSYEPPVSQRDFQHEPAPSVEGSESHQGFSTDMHQMVESLLAPSGDNADNNISGSNETSYGMHTDTAWDIFGDLKGSHPEPQQQQMKPRISGFPGFSPSAFSPRPAELRAAGAAKPAANGRWSASILGHSNTPDFSSSIPVQPNGVPESSFRKVLHQPVRQPFGGPPDSSAGFSASSSLCQNSPAYGLQKHTILNGRAAYNMLHHSDTVQGTPSDYERQMLLQSSAWDGSQPAYVRNDPTPPHGQGS